MIIQAPSHGKCMVDGLNGFDKTIFDMFFDYLVGHPEVLMDGMKSVTNHTRGENGTLVSLAQVYYDILSDPYQSQGAISHDNRVKKR